MSAAENKRNEQVDVNKCYENNLSGLGAMHIINIFFLKEKIKKRRKDRTLKATWDSSTNRDHSSHCY